MATRFQPLQLKNADLFGVRLSGGISRSDKGCLTEMAAKCLQQGKVNLVLDLSELGVIGGSGARILAGFQAQLTATGGEAVFVGASETIRSFLTLKFAELPLRFFHTVADADSFFHADNYDYQARARELAPAPEPVAPVAVPVNLDEIGAIGFADDVPECLPDDTDLLADEAVPEPDLAAAPVPDPQAPVELPSRRRHHKYTSLPEAVAALGNWSEDGGHEEFATSLGNLLFSHGLADESLLLTLQGDDLVDAAGKWQLAVTGALAQQASDLGAPMTMLDVQVQDLTTAESDLLEQITPDIILPLKRDDQLSALLLLNRNGAENEYSVAEHFALELLMRVLVENQNGGGSADLGGGLNVPTPADDRAAAGAEDDQQSGVMLELALNLPEADDKAHFWRLFVRYVQPLLPVETLAFLPPNKHRARVCTGLDERWERLNLGEKKLQHFFGSMSQPVEIAALPAFFRDIKKSLTKCGATWIIGINWDQEFLGTVFLSFAEEFEAASQADLLTGVFNETGRLLAQFDDRRDHADVNLNLVRLLISQREQRCHGADHLTESMCDELHFLADVMGFPPEQERNLIYGCLLRDIGLIGEEDALMRSPENMEPERWPIFRKHPEVGVELLAGLNLPQIILDVVRCHHERFNGSGFPRGLAGRKIPLAARVVTVVENFVAMTRGMAGQPPLSPAAAAEVLRENLGNRYDPDIVNLFLQAKAADPVDPADHMVDNRRRTPARV